MYMPEAGSDAGGPGFLAAVAQRRRAEEDVQLLANRINHLKAEEERARRKVQEVREKTQHLAVARERRATEQARKAAAEEAARRAEEARRGALRQQDLRREASARRKREKKCGELASAVQEDRAARAAELQRAAELEQGKQRALRDRATTVRRSEYTAQQARARVAIERRENARSTYEDRRTLQSRRIDKATELLESMEKEEMEVLERLQHSQQLYEAACKEYEVVRGSGVVGRPLASALALPAIARGSTPPPPLRTTPRASDRALAAYPVENVASVEKARPASSVSTAPSERSGAVASQPSGEHLAPGADPAPAKEPPTTITYTTMDGTTVTIPAVDGLSALELAESLNR